jgi:hypothetical protein
MTWTRASLLLVSAAAAAMAQGCSRQSAAMPIAPDRMYAVQPDPVRAESGPIAGEIVRMKITQRTEQGSGSGSSVARARLSGRLFLQNISADKMVHVAGARISYLDAAGRPLTRDGNSAEQGITFGSSSGALRRLDPGQNATELLDAEFPDEAVGTGTLKEIRIRLELSNLRKVETLSFAVSTQ